LWISLNTHFQTVSYGDGGYATAEATAAPVVEAVNADVATVDRGTSLPPFNITGVGERNAECAAPEPVADRAAAVLLAAAKFALFDLIGNVQNDTN
jgi:hypothetical protein